MKSYLNYKKQPSLMLNDQLLSCIDACLNILRRTSIVPDHQADLVVLEQVYCQSKVFSNFHQISTLQGICRNQQPIRKAMPRPRHRIHFLTWTTLRPGP